MAGQSYTGLSQRTAAYADATALTRAEKAEILTKLACQKRMVPKNKADTVKFRGPVPFAPITTPLVEGVTPTSQQMNYRDVTVQLGQFGAWSLVPDKVVDMAEDPVLKDLAELSGDQAQETLEVATFGAIKAGTSVLYANGAARNAVNTVINVNMIRKASRFLLAQRAKKITSILDPNTKIGTRPVEAAYIAFCSSDLEHDLRNLTGFVHVSAYGSRQVVSEYELGSFENMRFVAHPLFEPWRDAGGAKGSSLSTSGVNADVYPIIVCGADSYGTVSLAGGNIKMEISNATASAADPLAQKNTVGWKVPGFAAAILNDAWLCRLEVAATAL